MIVCIFICVLGIIVLLSFAINMIDIKLWNNGRCFSCGHPWRFIRINEQGEEVYICPRCKSEITIRKKPKK